ncbi:hypothetical protein [Pontixanthobacter sp.]|uniref:hypothetical protein n=1 Tax=Pontixanthobacter sp. TaxID=2792078 RepID=UPI003C7C4C4F
MTQIHNALLLAAAMIGLALLAAAGFIPDEMARWVPFALLAIFPSVWLAPARSCGAKP